ncbi:MAG: amidohydrolase family protein [Candidatus Aminicenantes bacterium]|nr:amidohydrolase family protein [Candidatus Aminicenantes bacterium]
MANLRSRIIFTILLVAFMFLAVSCTNQTYDLVIKNGLIVDGTGEMAYKSDIAIKGNRIAKIGSIKENRALEIIDATGLAVTPGFIDVHTHCDRGIERVPTVDNYIFQGVTTVIGGNCGGHRYPLAKLYEDLELEGISINFGSLIGHNTIRREVMEYKMEAPTEEEMTQMKALVDQEMKAGGLGFSTGLSYLPGIYSKTEEIVELASVISPYDGIYASHIRDQAKHITEAIEEAIAIGEKNNLTVQISHIKLADDAVWGETERITNPVEDARGRGVNVFLDQYPYTATSSGFTSSFPSWAFEGGRDQFLERIKNPEIYVKIKDYIIERRLTSTRGINKLDTIYIANSRNYGEYEGKNLQEILLAQGKDPTIDNGVDLIIEIEKNGGASCVFFQMDEKDVEDLMKLTYNMHASDGGVQEVGRGVPHPRNYGTFPRVISFYVHEKGVLSLEEAIRKMTSLPAQVFKLKDRGLLKEGMYADICVFDLENFRDMATFKDPHQYSQGLSAVIVNGKIAVEDYEHTHTKSGMILYGAGKAQGAQSDH